MSDDSPANIDVIVGCLLCTFTSLRGSRSIWGRELARKAGDGWELKDRLQGLVRHLNVSRPLVDGN